MQAARLQPTSLFEMMLQQEADEDTMLMDMGMGAGLPLPYTIADHFFPYYDEDEGGFDEWGEFPMEDMEFGEQDGGYDTDDMRLIEATRASARAATLAVVAHERYVMPDHDEYTYSPDFKDYVDMGYLRQDISRSLLEQIREWESQLQCRMDKVPWSAEEYGQIRKSRNFIYGSPPLELNMNDWALSRRRSPVALFGQPDLYCQKSVRPDIAHFQLRHVVAPVNQNEVYYTQDGSVCRLNPITGESNVVINSKYFHCGTSTSALAADNSLLVIGGLAGQYGIKSQHDFAEGQLASDGNGITNHISLVEKSLSAQRRVVFAFNDCTVQDLDLETQQVTAAMSFEMPMNCTSHNPVNMSQRVMVGDDFQGLVVDIHNQQVVTELQGHTDYGFACEWSPDGYTVATGNQDGTVRIYDARRWTRPVEIFTSELNGAIRSLAFDQTGRYLAVGEPIDFVSVLDLRNDTKQTLDMIGQIAGIGFTPGEDGFQDLTVGVSDSLLGGIVKYRPVSHQCPIGDCVL